MESIGLKNYRVGETFSGYCIIRKMELKFRKNGESYLKMEFGDSSGRLAGKIWSFAQERYEKLKTGQIVKIRGKIQQYRRNKEIHVESLKQVKKEDRELRRNLLPLSRKDQEELKKEFFRHKASIANQHLKALLDRVFMDEAYLERYLEMPSGKLWHHQYLYGMLEHLVCMLDLAEIMFKHYPELNLELLKSALMMHFLGNVREFDQDGFINYSKEGRLLGHTFLTTQQLDRFIGQMDEFPPELKLQLYHLIISNQAIGDESSPVPPMTREAIVLSNLRRLDIQANAVERILYNDKLQDSDWTKFNNLFGRFLYTKKYLDIVHTD